MRVIFGLLLALGPLLADGIPREEYRARRDTLRKSLDGVVVLFGANESADLHAGFFQESNFLYLSGWREPGAILLITPQEETLFLPTRDAAQEKFTGRKLGPSDEDAPQKTGFEHVRPVHTLGTAFMRALETWGKLYTAPGNIEADKLKRLAPFYTAASAVPPLAKLRLIKSPDEIRLITDATNATIAAHRAAWSRMKPGQYEYNTASVMTNVYFDRGCERSAYAPIVGSGPNSVTLHYSANRRRMDSGELVVMDVGAECSGYATDVTRTVPVNGKFTARQREIYDVVLGAQKAAIAAVKPGIKLRGDGPSLQQIAFDYINTHGKDLHSDPLGKYFIHGVGHFVGLDVHDPGDLATPLEAGMVITIEPGIYIPEENLGIRIEDTLLVTAAGAKNLSEALPRDPKEIEKLVGK